MTTAMMANSMRIRMEHLVAELRADSPVALFERAASLDSTGHSESGGATISTGAPARTAGPTPTSGGDPAGQLVEQHRPGSRKRGLACGRARSPVGWFGRRGITADEAAAPDERTDRTEAHPKLVDLGKGNGHTAPHDTRAADRGAVPRRCREERALRDNYTGIA